MAGYADDLSLAHLLADTADSISMSRFRALDLKVESKPDLTPVSDADTAVEQAIRSTLARARPRDGVLGEDRAAGADHDDLVGAGEPVARGGEHTPAAAVLGLVLQGSLVGGVAQAEHRQDLERAIEEDGGDLGAAGGDGHGGKLHDRPPLTAGLAFGTLAPRAPHVGTRTSGPAPRDPHVGM